MQTHQLPITIPELKVKYPPQRPVPSSMPNLFFIGLINGSRGSGKTQACIQLVKLYDRAKTFDKIFFWSPTFKADPKYSLLEHDAHYYKLTVFETFHETQFHSVIDEMRADLKEYDIYTEDLKIWKKFCKVKDPDKMTDEEVIRLEELDFEPPETDFHYGRPTFLLVFDDLAGNRDLYRSDSKGFFAEWAIKHRHDRASVLFLTQTYQNGVPRQLRSNLSLLILFAQKNKEIRKSVSMEYASFVDADTFEKMWEFATREPHSFFFCDFDGKKEVRYRVGFDLAIKSNLIASANDEQHKTVPQRKEGVGGSNS